jgi:hypothetical protein
MAACPHEASGIAVPLLAILFGLIILMHGPETSVSPADAAKFAKQEAGTAKQIANARKIGTFIPGRF